MNHVDLQPSFIGLEAKLDIDPDGALPVGNRAEIVVTVGEADSLEEAVRSAIESLLHTLNRLGFKSDSLSFAIDWFDKEDQAEVTRILSELGYGTWAYRMNDDDSIEIVDK